MPIQNLAAFAQYRRLYHATLTGANSNYTTPSNSALLSVAGPDGTLVTRLSAIPRATVTATQIQLFSSKDGGTTFNFLQGPVMAAASVLSSTQISPLAIPQFDGSLISETNPIPLSGVTDFGTSTPTQGGISLGSVNVQLLPYATGVTALTAGTIVDFEAGLTNTSTCTLTVGTAPAASVVRDATGAALSAGDLTVGFRYRVRCDGSFWRLFVTDRLYVAAGLALAGGIVVTAEQADF